MKIQIGCILQTAWIRIIECPQRAQTGEGWKLLQLVAALTSLKQQLFAVLVHFHCCRSNFPPFTADSSQLCTIKDHLHIRRFALTQVLTLLEQAIHIQSRRLASCRRRQQSEGCAIYTNLTFLTRIRELMGDISISNLGKFELSGH